MASKELQISPFITNSLVVFLSILSLIPSYQALYFKYPTAFTLEDKKIFVIHSLGIDICDSLYKTSTNIIEFEEEISESDLYKISISKYSSGEFIIMIVDTIYIFDGYGQKILSYTFSVPFNTDCFTLSAHSIFHETNNDYYYFLFGYIDQSSFKLNLYYYSLDTSSKTLSTASPYINYSNNMRNTGVSCEFVQYGSDEYILCIYETYRSVAVIAWDNDIFFTFFKINQNSISFVKNLEFEKNFFLYIRSTTKSINSKPFFCGITDSNVPRCFIYDYYDINSQPYYDDGYSKYCINKPYNIKTYYFPETGEYVFSCLTTGYGIQTTIYDKNMAQISDIQTPSKRLQRTFDNCGEFYYSILYSAKRNKYYIISDINCDEYKQFYILNEEDEEEIVEEESNLKEEEKYHEEKEEENYQEEKAEEKLEEKAEEKLEEKAEEKLEEKFEEEKLEEKAEEKYPEEKEEEKLEEKAEEKYPEEELKEEKKEINHSNNEEEIEKEKETELNQEIEKELENEPKYEREYKEENIEKSYLKETETMKEEETREEKETLKEAEKNIQKATDIFKCHLEKCSECNEESEQLNLCTKCNKENNYYPLTATGNNDRNVYLDCYDESTKPQGFYLDKQDKEYKLCYSNCKTCDFGGDANENNCTSCKGNLIPRPDTSNSSNSTNCVVQCTHFYYYQGDQYKCTGTESCPENFELEINEKRKCIDSCENDNTHKIQYDGECYKDLPEGTTYDEIKNIGKDSDLNKCKLNEKKLRLTSNKNITEAEIETKAKLYAKEFDYTKEHVTVYKNDFYSITLYKDTKCLSELNLNIDEINFGECYTKIKEELDIVDNLLIVIISKIINGISYTIDRFIFKPDTGEKINVIGICPNQTITVEKNLKNQIQNSENFELYEELTKQDINIFDKNSDFYTDLCFHFKSPIDGKDIPLKDRLKLFFPNITLCDEGCHIKGVNLTSLKASCECTLNNLLNNNIFGNNLLVQKSLGEVQEILTKTNIEVMKCYKDVFDQEMYKNNTGFFIVILLIFIQLICIIIYFCNFKIKIKKYVLAITDKYLYFLRNKLNPHNNISKPNNLLKPAPPKNNPGSGIKLNNGNININERKFINNKSKTIVRKQEGKNTTIKIINNPLKFSNKLSFSLSNDSKQNYINSKNNFERKETIKNGYEPIMPDLSNHLNINIQEFIKTDPDDMDYDDAIREDKRTFCQYFYSRIKTEQIILSTFLKHEVLRPIPIKIILLILDIDLYLIINGLFFNENYISDLLHSGPDTVWSFVNRIFDRIIIITITGVIINYIIEFFFVEESKIKKIFKRENGNIIVLKYEIVELIKCTYRKYNIFIIISSIIMIFSLYYIFSFNNVYPCIKAEWLKSSIIIIIIMQILPIILCFLDTSIRFISFKCKSERLFRLSSIFL